MERGRPRGYKTVEYTQLQAAKYQQLYRLCLMVEKHNKVQQFKALISLRLHINLGMVNAPYLSSSMLRNRVNTGFSEKEKALILACLQYLAYKNFLRVRISMNKLIENRRVKKMAVMVKAWNKMKLIGTKRIFKILNQNRNLKIKAAVLKRWRSFSRFLEIEHLSK